MKTRQRIAMKLKRVRVEREMSQETLAAKAKVSRGYLARVEIGRHEPSVSVLQRTARALGVPVTRLLE